LRNLILKIFMVENVCSIVAIEIEIVSTSTISQ